MPNFLVKEYLVSHSISTENIQLQQHTINKFNNDKLCVEDEHIVIVIEGVILNKISLCQEYGVDEIFDLCVKLYSAKAELFFESFRGSFSGLLYDKKKKKVIIFTDHIGDKAVFYSQKGKLLAFGSELKYITELFNLNKIDYSLDIAGAYSALTYGYMISDLTYIKDVHRLRGGTYLTFDLSGELRIKEYHRFEYKPNYKLTEIQIIEKMDSLFNNAIKMQLDKNDEYGYADFAALSAGLDSRMTTFAISKIKKSDFTSFTYSPIGFHDQTTSAEIVKHLKNNYIFQSDYTGKLLLDIDGSISNNEGLYMYFGAAVLKDYFEKLDRKNIGIIHSGQIGDVIVGCFSDKPKDRFQQLTNVDMHSKKFSKQFYENFDFEKYSDQFQDREIYSIYNRGFCGVNSGSCFVFQQFTETLSPFCDVEFCEFCLTIPLEKRVSSYIYDKWILEKYSEAAKFKHNGTRVIGGHFNGVNDFIEKVIRKIKKKLGLWNNAIHSVTPLNIWSNKEEIKKGLDKYFDEHISLLDNYLSLKEDCILLYRTGTALEKNQVLTLLGSVKLFFS